jgi:hypothetical protein
MDTNDRDFGRAVREYLWFSVVLVLTLMISIARVTPT